MLRDALDLRTKGFLLVLVALAVFVPAANLYAEQGSSLHLPSFAVALFGKYLTYALLALSVDLIWGYCGILSLGHGAFFALGGYAMGLHLMREVGTRRSFRDPVLPRSMLIPRLGASKKPMVSSSTGRTCD